MNTTTEPLTAIPLKKQDIEIVERKGIGHPDSICDGIAESISQTLSRYYIENFGRILHHSTDQVQLVGGKSNPVFGGGEILQPMYLLLSGRATMFYGSDIIPIHRIAIESARNYLRENLPHLNVDLHIAVPSSLAVDVSSEVGSIEMTDLRGQIKGLTNVGSIKAVNIIGEIRLATKVGDIELVAHKELSAKIQAATKVGSINSDFPLEISKKDFVSSTASGTIGSGEKNVCLITEVGKIRIKKQASENTL